MFDGHYYVKKNSLFTFGLSFWLLLPRFAFTRPPMVCAVASKARLQPLITDLKTSSVPSVSSVR
jgi:hypothetical protein